MESRLLVWSSSAGPTAGLEYVWVLAYVGAGGGSGINTPWIPREYCIQFHYEMSENTTCCQKVDFLYFLRNDVFKNFLPVKMHSGVHKKISLVKNKKQNINKLPTFARI